MSLNNYNYLSDESIVKNETINCRLTINYDESYSKFYPEINKNNVALFSTYPEHDYTSVKRAICKKYNLDQVILGSGNEDFIIRINRLIKDKKWKVGIVLPIFYRTIETCSRFSQIMEKNLFKEDLEEYDFVWINNPNLFTGKTHTRDSLIELIKKYPKTIFGIDEAAIFSIPEWKQHTLTGHCKDLNNVVLLNSFSKMFGIAGLRAAFASGNSDILDEIEKIGPTFPYNSVAELFVRTILVDDNILKSIHGKIKNNKEKFIEILRKRNIEAVPSMVNCVFFKNQEFRKILERLGILCLDLDGQIGMEDKGVTRMTVYSSEKVFTEILNRLANEK
jgi:histidinol-phosphate/aromatic aminotransferase/cobyric acid decarboxylase-like protein